MTSINIDDFPIEINDDFLLIVIDLVSRYQSINYGIFPVTLISIDFRYQSIIILGGLNRWTSTISIDFRNRYWSINYVWYMARVSTFSWFLFNTTSYCYGPRLLYMEKACPGEKDHPPLLAESTLVLSTRLIKWIVKTVIIVCGLGSW